MIYMPAHLLSTDAITQITQSWQFSSLCNGKVYSLQTSTVMVVCFKSCVSHVSCQSTLHASVHDINCQWIELKNIVNLI